MNSQSPWLTQMSKETTTINNCKNEKVKFSKNGNFTRGAT
ncbi:hypothetical protein SAMN03080598_02996 [Algoriphagus boritolerans DSM 17298 = JCM 18970]|uniref:Uncharacterized protein n=1 Tax=Algoriphagus boritolerans DSM 17298 = JCM 18970 TaxID=1120964 RepID=A0A1H5YHW0_9BACT|nr:hypothetical protein SAMN03080598_02996 [Algoriphagus boritolerans DSM 17298 = JCM 18970]